MRNKRIYALLATFIGLLVAYLLLINPALFNKNTPAAKVLDNNIIIKEKELTTIKIISNQEVLVLENKLEEGWSIKGIDNSNIDPIKIYELITEISNMKTKDIIVDNINDLGIYGLEDPEIKLLIEGGNGESYELRLGNQLLTGNEYYFYIKGEENVYKVDSNVAKLLQTDINNLMKEKGNEDFRNTAFKKVTYRSQNSYFLIVPFETKTEVNFSNYYLNEPYSTKPELDITSEKYETILTSLSSIPPLEVIENKSENLGKYGLDDPILYICAESFEGDRRSLTLGNELEPGYYYALFNDENTVYTAKVDNLEELLNISAFDVANTAPVYTFLKHIKDITVTTEDKTYFMNFKEDKFTLNGLKMEQELRDIYLAMMELNADAESEKQEFSEKPEIRFEITFNNGDNSILDYISYDRNFFAIRKDGRSDFVIAKEKIINIIELLEISTK